MSREVSRVCMDILSQRPKCQIVEELQHSMMPEEDAVLSLNLGDMSVEQFEDLLKGSGNVRVKIVAYFFPVGKFSGFQFPVFSLLNHFSTGAAW